MGDYSPPIDTGGEPIVHHFVVTSATAGLTTGVTLFTPTVGDVILDTWVETDTAWNGTTPKMDVGTFVGGTAGMFSLGAGVVDLTQADAPLGGTGVIAQFLGSTVSNDLGGNGAALTRRSAPSKVTVANPLLAVVSTTGAKGGTATGATQGSSTIFVVTATPI